MKTFRSGTAEWYQEEKKRLNPTCEGCNLPFAQHACQHATVFYRHECHSEKYFSLHACPDPKNPLGLWPPVVGKRKTKPPEKPKGEHGWFKGEQYISPTKRDNTDGCDECDGSSKRNWWGGKLLCQNCVELCQLVSRMVNIHLIVQRGIGRK